MGSAEASAPDPGEDSRACRAWAVMVPEEHHEERFGHVVMLDPEGNEVYIA
jgi:hypothetical protein